MDAFWFLSLGGLLFGIIIWNLGSRWANRKEDIIEILPNKPTGPPPIPPPVPKVYGTVNPIYALTSVDPLTKDQAEKMQKELENHFFSNLARPHHKIPILELPKRKDEKYEPKENPKRKITY